jgi:hypothetical protein
VPRRRPVRPSLCFSDDSDLGEPIWATDFTDPMSTPSSKVDVQIAVVGSFASFKRSSRSSRKVFERLP